MSPQLDGALVVDKPAGPTSHDVVAVARRALKTKQIGHTGTLDPIASGVLVLLIGRATRLARFLAADTKEYLAEVRLGVETDSWDRTGAVVRSAAAQGPWPAAADVGREIQGLSGSKDQVPPPFSAKRVEGVRAYELARKGKEFALRGVPVVLHEATALEYTPPFLRLRLVCSSGFYVRSLVHELGARFGCGATLEELRRTASGVFTLESAVDLARLAGEPGPAGLPIVPLDAMLHELPAVRLGPVGLRKALHGNDVSPGDFTVAAALDAVTDAVRMVDAEGQLVAVARPAGQPGVLHPLVVLK